MAFKEWKIANRHNDSSYVLVLNKKVTTPYLGRLCRFESAKSREQSRQQILNAKSSDMKLFYRLVNKQRGKFKYYVNELSLDDTVYKFESEILTAWRRHFKTLATPADHEDVDEKYRQLVASEMLDIMDISFGSLLAQDSEDYMSIRSRIPWSH